MHYMTNLKVKFFLVLLITFNTLIIFSQKGEVIYQVKSLKEEGKGKISKGVEKEYPLMEFQLNFNQFNSSFELKRNVPLNNKWYNYAKIFTETQNKWFQDNGKKEAISNKEIKGSLYQVVYDRMKDWVLSEETRRIQGYLCFKATRKELNEKFSTKKNKKYIVYTAWYSPDIPFPYGPSGNGGLPGVILELSRSNMLVFSAKKVILNDKKTKVEFPKEGKRITKKEKLRLMRLARKVTPD